MPLAARAADTKEPTQAAGIETLASSDADHADVLKLALVYDFDFTNFENYRGLRLESFTFSTPGRRRTETRGYFQFAGMGESWKWQGMVGTDGSDVLGNISLITDGPFRQEYFGSRDLVETAQGLHRGLYSTFSGAAYDIPLDDRNIVTALIGAQKFSGENWRMHMRGQYIYVVEQDLGLSLQLRVRSFWDSVPHEFDYFSPRWYVEAIPTFQVRRFYARWQYLVALGWGMRRNTGSDWRSAGSAYAAMISPTIGSYWYVKADFTYSNMPVTAGYSYNYEQATLNLIRKF
jgi:hypothetical protein